MDTKERQMLDTIENKYANKLSKMVQVETVYSLSKDNQDKFDKFYEILKNLFPNLAKKCMWQTIHGSLLITWKSEKPKLDPYIFLAHCDVVEAEGKWEQDPFSGKIIEGYIWGRGSFDNKGTLFSVLQAAEELIEAGFKPNRDIYLVSGNDEEKLSEGAKAIAKYLYNLEVKSAITFDEGGTVLQNPLPFAKGNFAMVSLGEKRSCDLRFIAKSMGGHTSSPTIKSPLVRLCRCVAEIKNKNPFKVEVTPIVQSMLKAYSLKAQKYKFILKYPKMFSLLIKKLAKASIPELNAMMQTTIDFTMAKGSDTVNIIPDEAWIGANIRVIHHEKLDKSLKKLKKIANKYDVEIEMIKNRCDSRVMDPNCDAYKLVTKAVSKCLSYVDICVPYLSIAAADLREFDYISNQCIRFTPLFVNMEELGCMHGLNERLRISCLPDCVKYYKFLIKN